MKSFEDELGMLISREMPHARRDPQRMGDAIGALMEALSLACAIGAQGNPEHISELLDGVTVNLYEAAAAKAPLARTICGRAA